MHKQALTHKILEKCLPGEHRRKKTAAKLSIIKSSINLAKNNLNEKDILKTIILKNKQIFLTSEDYQKTLFKKISKDLSRCINYQSPSRDEITKNIKLLLSENSPYKVYRYDIKSFFESFDDTDVRNAISSIPRLSPHNKKLINIILDKKVAQGGKGVPRGLPISIPLSELMMQDFDKKISILANVFFYKRYVDDIIIITSGEESEEIIKNTVIELLPKGLILNTEEIKNGFIDGTIIESDPKFKIQSIDYLGYRYIIKNGLNKKKTKREINIEISEEKITKIKKRICRSFLNFHKNKDFELLQKRIKFLSSNFSIFDIESRLHKKVGIYHNYTLIDKDCQSLDILDKFLQEMVHSRKNRVNKSFPAFKSKQKFLLSELSFKKGHNEIIYTSFSIKKMSEIKKCWSY